MKVPTLGYCCCGVSLKLGTLLIGLISLVWSVGTFASAMDFYYDVEEVIDNPEITEPNFVKIREHLVVVQGYVYLCFFEVAMGTILAAVLLIGYCISNRVMLRSWVIGIIILQVMEVGANFSMCMLFGHWLYMLTNLVVFVNFYFAWVVNSYAREIIKGSTSSIA